MEYHRTKDGQIRADIAFRLGIILQQYEDNISSSDIYNFDLTLHISILNTLLNNCLEILKEAEKIRSKEYESFDIKNELNLINFYGITNDFIIFNNLYPKITVKDVLTSIRHALSHPTALDIEARFPSTGYTSIIKDSDILSELILINSPDVIKNRPKKFTSKEELMAHKSKFNADYDYDKLEIIPKYIKIRISAKELKKLTSNLCIVLSQPVQKNWDLTFNPSILKIA